jgi:hypothetical protein
MVGLTDAELEVAEQRGTALSDSAVLATSAKYDDNSGRIVIELSNGCAYLIPPALIEDLAGAEPADLAEIEVEGEGFDLHFPRLDADIFVPALVGGVFGTQDWMRRLDRAGSDKANADRPGTHRRGHR